MLYKKFKETIKKYNLIQKNDRILVAFSGGPDSTALVLLLLEYQKELPFSIHLAHFNHKLRKEANRDETHVREFAKEFNLPITVGCGNVNEYAKKHSMNIEEAGRELRYSFLKEQAKKIKANKIALGHNLTDQAETFLMRIIRGTGLTGLSGIYPVKEGIFIRPLIEIEKEEIEAYLRERNIPFCIDRTNLDSRYLRNRIRIELLPFLKESFSQKIVSHLGKLSELIREENELIEKIAESELKKIEKKENGIYSIDYKKLESYPVALRRRILRCFIKKLKGDLRGITYKHIQSLLNLKKNKESCLIKGLKVKREGDLLFFKSEIDKILDYAYYLDINDEIEIKECNLKFRTEVISSFDYRKLDFNDNYRGYFDFEKLKFPLLVRNRRNGDAYRPLGAPGRKKLKEIMRAKRIPLRERKSKPVFLSQNEIIWVLGLPVSEEYKVTSSTKKILLIERIN